MTKYAPLPRPLAQPAYVSVALSLQDPSSEILLRHKRLLRDCVALAQQRWSFDIEAAVVLPDELQMLCRFDDAQFDVASVIKLVRAAFARHAVPSDTAIWHDHSKVEEVEPHLVARHCRRIENAPVRAGLARSPQDWPHSSIHRSAAQSSHLGADVA